MIVDAVVHAYNFAPENWEVPASERFSEGAFFKHRAFTPYSHQLSKNEFLGDFPVHSLVQEIFTNSDVDVAIFHSVPLFDFFRDGLVSMEKGRAFKAVDPSRSLWYGAVETSHGIDAAKEDMAHQATQLGVDGFKFYPATYVKGRTLTWRMDDEHHGLPLVQAAQDLGIRNIAVHKALPLGPTTTQAYRIDDVENAAALFPEVNIQIVHAGAAFIEQTASILGRFPNVYANMELSFGYLLARPREFARIIGELLYWGRPEQILFASGCNIIHPQPLIDAFCAFDMPEDLRAGWGYREVTEEDKVLILGGNAARIHDLDVRRIANRGEDRQSLTSKRDTGPWASLRSDHSAGSSA